LLERIYSVMIVWGPVRIYLGLASKRARRPLCLPVRSANRLIFSAGLLRAKKIRLRGPVQERAQDHLAAWPEKDDSFVERRFLLPPLVLVAPWTILPDTVPNSQVATAHYHDVCRAAVTVAHDPDHRRHCP